MEFTGFSIDKTGTLTIEQFRGTVGELLAIVAHEQRHYEVASALRRADPTLDHAINELVASCQDKTAEEIYADLAAPPLAYDALVKREADRTRAK